MIQCVAKCYAQNLGTKNSIAFFPRKTALQNISVLAHRLLYIRVKKERMKMKNLKMESVKLGFVLTKDHEGFYHLYDVKMCYDVLITKVRASVVRFLKDEKAMIEYSKRKIVETYTPESGA
jgi:hypothetical protein